MKTKNGKLVISDSMLELQRHCSTKFWFNYLEKPLVQPRVVQFEFGSLVHKMFEDFFKRKNPEAKMYESAHHFANVFAGKWMGIDYVPKDPRSKKAKLGPLIFADRDYADPVTGKMKRTNEKAQYRALGEKVCKRFWEENQDTPPSHVLLEYHFEHEVGPDPISGKSWVLQGFIDRIELRNSSEPPVYALDENGEIKRDEAGKPQFDYSPAAFGSAIRKATDGELWCIDYKTGYHAPSKEALRSDTQFSTYDLALELEFPNVPVRKFALHVVTDDWKFVETPRSATDRVELMKRIFEQGRMIENEEYRFLGDMYICGRCAFVQPCGDLRNWADENSVDPEKVMRWEAPLLKGRSLKHIQWKEGRLIKVDSDSLLGDVNVFGYGRHAEEHAPTEPVADMGGGITLKKGKLLQPSLLD